jgi:hypothetical protein
VADRKAVELEKEKALEMAKDIAHVCVTEWNTTPYEDLFIVLWSNDMKDEAKDILKTNFQHIDCAQVLSNLDENDPCASAICEEVLKFQEREFE